MKYFLGLFTIIFIFTNVLFSQTSKDNNNCLCPPSAITDPVHPDLLPDIPFNSGVLCDYDLDIEFNVPSPSIIYVGDDCFSPCNVAYNIINPKDVPLQVLVSFKWLSTGLSGIEDAGDSFGIGQLDCNVPGEIVNTYDSYNFTKVYTIKAWPKEAPDCAIEKNYTIHYFDDTYGEGKFIELKEIISAGAPCPDGFATFNELADFIVIPPGVGNSALAYTCCSDGFSISAGIQFNFSINAALSAAYAAAGVSIGVSSGGNQTFTITQSPSGMEADKCYNFCIAVPHQLVTYIENCYEDPCDIVFGGVNTNEVTVLLPRPDLAYLKPELLSGWTCPDDIERPRINEGGSGSINLEFENPENIFSIDWSGPDGFNESGISISYLEEGEYCYLLTNQCCETFEGCVILCENKEILGCEFDSEMNQYCCEVDCPSADPGFNSSNQTSRKSSGIFLECYNDSQLTFTDWQYGTNGKCTRDVLLNDGTYIDTQQRDAFIVDTYDENLKMCVREYYCEDPTTGNSPDSMDPPTFPQFGAFWQFGTNQSGQEVCFRSVTCNGNILEEKDEIEPDVEWEYDETFGQCVGTIYCDGFEIIGLPIRTFPINSGFWSFDIITKKCRKTIQCTTDIDSQIEITKDPQVTYSYNASLGMCVPTTIACDGISVAGFLPNIFPHSVGNWAFETGMLKCFRNIECTPNSPVITQTIDAQILPAPNNNNCTPLSEHNIYCDNTYIDWICGTQFTDVPEDDSVSFRSTDNSVSEFTKIDVKPNPFTNELFLDIESIKEEKCKVVIINSIGQEMIKNTFHLFKGDNKIEIEEASLLPEGIYFMVLLSQNDKIIISQKLVKIN